MILVLRYLSLIATLGIGAHGEYEAGQFVGLGVLALALPVAIDCYVVAAVWADEQVIPALSVLALTVGGGHFIIGMGDPDHPNWAGAIVGAVIGVVIVALLFLGHLLGHTLEAKKLAKEGAEKAEAERAVAERKAERVAREVATEAERQRRASEQKEVREAEIAERQRQERAALEIEEGRARIARETAEHAARLEAERLDRERAAAEARARVLAEQAEVDRVAKERAEAEVAAAKASKVAAAKPPASGLHVVSGQPTLVDLLPKVIKGEISKVAAAERVGCTDKTIQRALRKAEQEAGVPAGTYPLKRVVNG